MGLRIPSNELLRSSPAVVSASKGDYIITIGGDDGSDHWITRVELLHVRRRTWYRLTNLPQPLTRPLARICGHQLHVIDEDGRGYSCSLHALLLSSDQPIATQSIPNLISWTSLPRLPVTYSTVATLCGQLVIVGGKKDWSSSVNSIHQLVRGKWVEIGTMHYDRWRCLVVNPSPHKMIVVGGYQLYSDSIRGCDIVEEFVVA